MQLDSKPESIHIQGTIEGLDPLKYRWATHAKTKCNILVKKRGLVAQPTQILNELQLVQKLEHPNILPLFEHFEDEQAIYFCLPLMNLGSAERLLNLYYNDGFPEPAIVHIIKHVLLACQYLHNKNIIHRGIRAKKILLDSSGSVKLTGFENALLISGCNRWIGVEEKVHDFRESLSSVFVWLAPEIMKQDLCGYGVSSDVYSIGITICELGNGFAPFQEMEAMQILFEKLRGSTPFLLDSTIEGSDSKITYSAALHEITAECLCYDDAQRSSCDSLLKHTIFNEQSASIMSFSNLLPEAAVLKYSPNNPLPSS